MAGIPWNNADGLTVTFPNFYADPYNYANRLFTVKTFGCYKEAEMFIDLSQLAAGATSYTSDLTGAGTRNGFNTGDDRLPADACITAVRGVVTQAAVGGTSFTVGTYQLNGTAITANGLVTATEGAIANLGTIGNKIVGAGAYTNVASGTAGLGTLDSYVGVTAQGTFTAGRIRLVISYFDPHADVDTTR